MEILPDIDFHPRPRLQANKGTRSERLKVMINARIGEGGATREAIETDRRQDTRRSLFIAGVSLFSVACEQVWPSGKAVGG